MWWCGSQGRLIRARVGSALDDDRSCLRLRLRRREDLDRDLGPFGLEREVVLAVGVAWALLPADVGQLGRDEGAFVAVAAAWAHRDVVPGGRSGREAAGSPTARRAERDGRH